MNIKNDKLNIINNEYIAKALESLIIDSLNKHNNFNECLFELSLIYDKYFLKDILESLTRDGFVFDESGILDIF